MMKFNSRILIVGVIFACLIGCLWAISGRELFYRYSFSRKICENLMLTESLPYDSCFISNEVPDVMGKMMPIGTEKEYVENAMQGFEIISSEGGSSSLCHNWVRLDYKVIPRWAFLFDETYEFIFCDGKLVDRIWHE